MAREAGISQASVQRLWAANAIKPHLSRTFKLSKDKQFEAKFWDMIRLYLDPPEKVLVLCCDEKSQCQVLERTQPGLPLCWLARSKSKSPVAFGADRMRTPRMIWFVTCPFCAASLAKASGG